MGTVPQWLKRGTEGWLKEGLIKQTEGEDERTGKVRILVKSSLS